MSNDNETNWKEKALEAIGILKKISQPPLVLATVTEVYPEVVNISTVRGDTYVVNFDPRLKGKLEMGQTVQLSPETMAVVKIDGQYHNHSMATIKDVMPDGRVKVEDRHRTKIIQSKITGLKPGTNVVVDNSYSVVLESLGNDTQAYHLDKVPETPWSAVGGLEKTVEEIRRSLEIPFTHKELYAKFPNKKPIKGALLHGPPGCGKTLIGKAIAYNLALQRQKKKGGELNGYFLYLAAPEFLQKYVGVGEGMVRELFGNARETAAKDGDPVVIFIDEAEAVYKQRGTGISSDAADSILNQTLVEMDGINSLENVVVVYATNRPEMLDAALIRPGRIDRKFYVPRPTQQGAKQIFDIYMQGIPFKKTTLFGDSVKKYAEFAAEEVFRQDKPVLDITFNDHTTTQIHYYSMFSGASVVNIVNRATDYALDRGIAGGKCYVDTDDIHHAVQEEYLENRSLVRQILPEDIKQATNGRFEDIARIAPVATLQSYSL